MKKQINFLGLLLLSSLFFISCNNDDSPVNEEELITTVRVTLTNGANTITLTSTDLDGEGPNAPVITVSGNLIVNTTYSGSISFLNELEDPAEDITLEVEEEGDEHQVFYQISNSLGTLSYTDLDTNGNPIGLNFSLSTGSSTGNGTLTVTLRHEPNKTASGVADGDITNAGGSTDAEVSFPIQVVDL